MADDRELLFAFIAAFTLGALYMYLKSGQSTDPQKQPVYTGYMAYEPPVAVEGSVEEVIISNTEEVKPEFDEKGRIVGMIITREVRNRYS